MAAWRSSAVGHPASAQGSPTEMAKQALPVSVSLRPYREREAELLMVYA